MRNLGIYILKNGARYLGVCKDVQIFNPETGNFSNYPPVKSFKNGSSSRTEFVVLDEDKKPRIITKRGIDFLILNELERKGVAVERIRI